MTDAIEKAKALLAEGKQIDAPLALELLKIQVAKKPEGFVYSDPEGNLAGSDENRGCFNLHPVEPMSVTQLRDFCGTDRKGAEGAFVPGCIVGSVFVDVVGIEGTAIGGGTYGTNRDAGEPFSRGAIYILNRAQASQDSGSTWAAAAAAAAAAGWALQDV